MIVVAKLKALSGKETDMENELKKMVSNVAGEDGTLIYTLHRDLNDPTVFLFYEKYTDAEALTRHSQTPYFKALFATLAPMLDGKPEIAMYEELAGITD